MSKQEILNTLIDTHEQRVIGVLKKLEDEVIADIIKSTDGGVKLTTKLAIQLRPNLKKLIEENYLSEVDNIIRNDYDQIVKEYQKFIRPLPIPNRFKTLTKANLEVINQLKFLSFSGFEDIASTYLDVLANEVYQSAIVGKDFKDMVKNIRAKINGVYQRSDENEINRLVDFIDKNKYSNNPSTKAQVTVAKETLQSKYASNIYGENMRRYASQMAHDSLMQFDGQFTKYKALEAGITSYKYTGTNITTTRPFCRSNLNRVFTEEEANNLWANTRWAGKSGSDPFINRGGYRCRHSFIPYDPEWEDLLED